jgi:hypothetical protein
MYAHRPAGPYGVEAAAVVVGMARGAVDEYELGIRTRTTNRDMATGWGHLYNAMTDASAREPAKARLASGADRPSE